MKNKNLEKKFNTKKVMSTIALSALLFTSFGLSGEASAASTNANDKNVAVANVAVADKTVASSQNKYGLETLMRGYVANVKGAELKVTNRGLELSLNLDTIYKEYKTTNNASLTALGLNELIDNYEMFKSVLGDEFVMVMVQDLKTPDKFEAYLDVEGELTYLYEGDIKDFMTEEQRKGYENLNIRAAANFTDIKGHYAENAIIGLYQLGIVQGTSATKFSPERTLTRGEFSAMLSRTIQVDEAEIAKIDFNKFSDLKGHWAADDVKVLYLLGIVGGTSDKTFSPNAVITREQAAAMLARYFDALGLNPNVGTTINFKDANKVSAYAKEGVGLLTNMGVVSGKPGNVFDPKGALNRGQMAKILYGVISYTDYTEVK